MIYKRLRLLPCPVCMHLSFPFFNVATVTLQPLIFQARTAVDPHQR
jgi:hypothetical protein